MAGGHILEVDVPQAEPTGAPGGDFQRIQSSPEAFGGAVAGAEREFGAGLEKVGHTGLDILTDWNTKQNDLHAAEVNTWYADRTTELHSEFMNLKGKAALNGLPDYKQRLSTLRQEALEQAPSLQEKHHLTNALTSLQDQYWRYWSGHAASELNTYDRTVAQNAIAASSAQAVNSIVAGDEHTFRVRLREQDMEVYNFFGNQGYDEKQIASEAQKRRGITLKTAIETVAAGGNVKGAQDLFERYRSEMDPASVLATTQRLKGDVAKIEGQSIADQESGHGLKTEKPVADLPGSFVAAIKATEGFAPKAQWDFRQHSVGYGTKAKSPDEVITRDEADKRFGDEVKNAAKFVDGVKGDLDPGTRAALISLTYNAGGDWANSGLGKAIKDGDLDTARRLFLQYNQAGGAYNQGLAARRYREAQWFGQNEAPSSSAPLVDKAGAYERVVTRTADNPLTQAAAVARLNQVYSIYHSQEVVKNAQFDVRKKDTLAEAEATGNVLKPLMEEDFVNRYGATNLDQALEAYGDYTAAIEYGGDRRAIRDMTPEDQRVALERQTPVAGMPGFAAQQKRRDQLTKAIEANDKLRREDPAESVSHTEVVRAAALRHDPAKPESFQELAAVRLAAQEQMGIDEASRSPITKNEALALTVPLRRMLPGTERATIQALVENFKKTFGPYADQAFEYALHANKLNAENMQSAARIMKKVGAGEVVPREEARQADNDAELSSATQALTAVRKPLQTSAIPLFGPGVAVYRALRGSGEGEAPPDARDIVALRADPKLAERFDRKYGEGKSKKILETYPVGVPKKSDVRDDF